MSAIELEEAPAAVCADLKASPPAVLVARNIAFEGLREFFELASSYARSGEEAAFRGDQLTVGVHVQQLRAVVVEIIGLRNELFALGAEGGS